MQNLLHMDRAGGAENFEGMAYLGSGRVLLASDSGGKKGASTVFLLVNLPQRAPPVAASAVSERP
ncbi:MAG: hypothetical protein Q8O50_02945 [Hydrogenophaga sp.]|nr:hypothetical protein [Hydrogenophaga sp.]